MKLLFLTFFTLLLFFQNAFSEQESTEIEIFGNEFLSKNTILKEMKILKKNQISMQDLEFGFKDLINFYRNEGYYFAEIDSVVFSENQSRIKVFITEGNQLKLRTLNFSGNKFIETENIEKEIFLKQGKTFREAELLDAIQAILDVYSENGFPFVQVKVSNFEIEFLKKNDSIDVKLKIDEESFVKIEKFRVQGNKNTQKDFILRETRIKLNEEFKESRIEKAQRRLQQTGLFDSVTKPSLFVTREKETGILFEVQEGKNNNIDGILGYLTDENGDSYFTGLLDLSFRNLFGRGKKLEARIEKRDKETQEFEISYFEPWVFGTPLGIGGNFRQLVQDSIYTEFAYGLNLKLPLTEVVSVSGLAEREEITPTFTGTQNPFFVNPSNSWNLLGKLVYEKIDFPLNPRKGFSYETTFGFNFKTNTQLLADTSGIEAPIIEEKTTVKTLGMKLSIFLPTLRKQVLAMKFTGKRVTSNEKEISVTDLVRFGGTKTLRGYLENQFLGDNVAWANIEYRFLQGRKSRVFAFYDFGFYTKNKTNKNFNFLDSFGFGLKIETRVGIIGIEYAIGKDDNFNNGKLHLGIINEF
ncbi:MAG: hypothetical protein DWQ06_01465 [Calditrichaeota bacterium]|nr:MAG: hypothetical protein DWQ06_01465 [Calditrichota bacterium]